MAFRATVARSISRMSSSSLPVVMRDTSSRSWTSRACACALRSMRSSACFTSSCRQLAAAQQVDPADDRVERRAQLVRERGEEFVLQAIGLLLAIEQLGALALRRLDLVEHAIERLHQHADLVAGRGSRRGSSSRRDRRCRAPCPASARDRPRDDALQDAATAGTRAAGRRRGSPRPRSPACGCARDAHRDRRRSAASRRGRGRVDSCSVTNMRVLVTCTRPASRRPGRCQRRIAERRARRTAGRSADTGRRAACAGGSPASRAFRRRPRGSLNVIAAAVLSSTSCRLRHEVGLHVGAEAVEVPGHERDRGERQHRAARSASASPSASGGSRAG